MTVGELAASRVTAPGRSLYAAASRVIAAVSAANIATSVFAPDWATDWIPLWTRVVAGIVGAGMVVALLTVVARGRLSARVFPAVVAAQIVLQFLLLAADRQGEHPPGVNFIQPGFTVAMCLVVFIRLPGRLRWVGLALLAVGYAGCRALGSDWVVAVGEVIITAVGAFTLRALLELIAEEHELVRRLEAQRLAAHVEAKRQETAQSVRDQWDRLLHDKVFGALLLTSRSTSFAMLAAARALAGDALTALGVDDGPDRERTTRLSALATRWGVRLEGDTELPDDLPDEVRDAFLAAASEVLANVSQHAGVDVVRSTISGSGDGLIVMMRDDGHGFAPTRIGRRFGVSRSIPGHLAAIGGTAQVDSQPGQGTTATLVWFPPAVEAPDAHTPIILGSSWRIFGWPATVVIPIVWAGAHAGLGLHFGTTGWADWMGAGRLLGWPWPIWLLALTLMATILLSTHPIPRWVPIVVVLQPLCIGLLVALTPPGPATEWRLWFIGASVPAALGLILSGHRIAGMTQALLALVAVITGLSWHGPRTLMAAIDVLQVPVLVAIGASVLMLTLDRANARISAGTEELITLRAAERARALEAAESRRRRAELAADVIPLLLRIWHGDLLTEPDRREAALVEADARDRLTGGILLTDEIRNAAHEARRRGAKVTLRATPGPDAAAMLSPFRRAVVLALLDSGGGSVVTASWQADEVDHPATLHVDAPANPPDPSAYNAALRGTAFRAELSPSEVWLEFLAPSRTPLSP